MAVVRKEKKTNKKQKEDKDKKYKHKGKKEVEISAFIDGPSNKPIHEKKQKKNIENFRDSSKKDTGKYNMKKSFSDDKNKKRASEAELERGPTKKQMREEMNSKVAKKNKSNENINENKADNKKIKTDKKTKETVEKRKNIKKPLKRKVETTNKVLYTVENINTHLLSARESKEKATNMLLFVLKQFKETPAEILAKVKILTTGKKLDTAEDCIQIAVLKHINAFYEISGTPTEGLMYLISTNSLLSKYLSDFIFSASFESVQYDHLFDELFGEICKINNKTEQMSFNDYIGAFYELDANEKFEEEVRCNYEALGKPDSGLADHEEDIVNAEDKCESTTQEEALEAENLMDKEESSGSTVELVSLTDDEEIERLDRNLGQMFSRGTITIEEQTYYSSIVNCLECLIKNNTCIKPENLIRVLYLMQFECIAQNVKFIVKDILKKPLDFSRVFTIFQLCSLVNPSIYTLYGSFVQYCGNKFDLLKFLMAVLAYEHKEFVISKIDKDAFYAIYNSELGKPFDDVLVELVRQENRREKLEELSKIYFKEEVKAVIEESLKKEKSKRNKKSKQNQKVKLNK